MIKAFSSDMFKGLSRRDLENKGIVVDKCLYELLYWATGKHQVVGLPLIEGDTLKEVVNKVIATYAEDDKVERQIAYFIETDENKEFMRGYEEQFRKDFEMENKKFEWVAFYSEFATKLIPYKNRQKELVEIIKEVYALSSNRTKYPFSKDGVEYEKIDPFTIFGTFNRGITDANRIALLEQIKEKFGIQANVPSSFEGIPVMNNMNSWFFAFDAGEYDIPNLWELFEAAINYADSGDIDNLYKEESAELRVQFVKLFDGVLNQRYINWNITMGLFWIRPHTFLSLDGVNRPFMQKNNIETPKKLISCSEYLEIIRTVKAHPLASEGFPSFSYKAWLDSRKKEKEEIVDKKRYWAYAPGPNAERWNEFYDAGIMGLGWDEIEDLTEYERSELKESLRLEYPEARENTELALWQFAKDINIGDVIYAKQGIKKIIGRGVVESNYYYDETRNEYKHCHKVNWTSQEIYEYEKEQGTTMAMKTLTELTSYLALVEDIEAFYGNDAEEVSVSKTCEEYTKDMFLQDVFIDEKKYDTILNLLKHKKNIILKGSPGVGKSYMAKKLAYSIVGEKDDSRVQMVQFHQSYSYEDFIMGYRPKEDGFELRPGVFYEFCKKASVDARPHFFIIDEINRGNISKILGELMLLIEADKRGEKHEMRLIYGKELFYVPDNLYIIGMMNTADRSLAIIDYALRRRFSFIDREPAFDNETFKQNVNDEFSSLINQVKQLNVEIANDPNLGKGFRIGHSYFFEGLSSEEIVEYDILPLLREYWDDDQDKILEWEQKLLND